MTFRCPNQDDAEANYFAMQLLVPGSMLKEFVRKHGQIDLAENGLVEAVAKKFGVSTTVAAFRLAEEGLMVLGA